MAATVSDSDQRDCTCVARRAGAVLAQSSPNALAVEQMPALYDDWALSPAVDGVAHLIASDAAADSTRRDRHAAAGDDGGR